MQKRDYSYYKQIFEGVQMPYAFVDLDFLDLNTSEIASKANGKKIRVASKSIRVPAVMKRILDSGAPYQGLMTFTADETVYLSQLGFDDLLMGYPTWHEEGVKKICNEIKKGKTICLMVDRAEHLSHLQTIARREDVVIPLCFDLDMSSDYPGIHFGVWRSSMFGKKEAVALADRMIDCSHLKLDGLMGYEAQIAGIGERMPGNALKNFAVGILKKKSITEIAERRAETVAALIEKGFKLRFVNGGGTGSFRSTTAEDCVTEVTAGSGFFSPYLFDHYNDFKYRPAAAFAIEVIRKPKDGLYTCLGGGYIASGSTGNEKQPFVYLPEGAILTANEGAGEVQSPIAYTGKEKLDLGSPVYLRHSKAGELCERFNKVYLVSDRKINGETNTYRGDGKCFL